MKRRLIAGLAAAVLACGGATASETSATSTVDITGTWEGLIRQHSAAETFTVVFRLNQEAGRAEGTYLTDFGGTGNMTGTVQANVFRFSAVVTSPGCPGRLTGSGRVDATASPPTMAVTYEGETCGGPETGEGVLVLDPATAPR